jgi:FtsP/CotA-like multicopper oxidase with cupredoxin domain
MGTPQEHHAGADPSRRQFLRRGIFLGAGTVLTPAMLLSAPDAAAEDVLRASRFDGAPDGRRREVWGYNHDLPGPLIRAREGQTLRIKVVNGLGVPTTVHWHGMHQRGTWRMDGVPGVSGPPIAAGAEFTYEFRADPAGTHWYHSHEGVQYANGLFGPLVVEERTPIAAYDREEVLFINDWFHQPADTLLAELLKPPAGHKMPARMSGKMEMKKDVADVPFQSGLINGKGRAAGDTRSPLTVVGVKKGETVRLRLVNGSSTFAFRFQVDGHPLEVIASDGAPLKSVVVDNLVFYPGERYDVLLRARGEGVHWVRAVTLDGHEVLAVLRYAGAARAEPEPGPVRWGPRALKAQDMRSAQPERLAERPREIPLRLGGSMMPFRWSINDQFYPRADPIVLDQGEPVRLVMRNPTGMDHPFHLHGQWFHVLGRPGALNVTDPPRKDNANIPAGSDLVLQWTAINRGWWFFHCHIEWHLATGMARVVEIGRPGALRANEGLKKNP